MLGSFFSGRDKLFAAEMAKSSGQRSNLIIRSGPKADIRKPVFSGNSLNPSTLLSGQRILE